MGVAVCGSNTLPLLIVFGSECVWDQLIVLNYLVILLHLFKTVIYFLFFIQFVVVGRNAGCWLKKLTR